MIQEFNRRFLRVRYPYENPLDRQRASGLLFVVVSLFSVWLLWSIFYFVTILTGDPLIPLTQFSLSALLPIVVIAVQMMVQRGHLTVASWIFVMWLTSSIGVANLENLTSVFMPFIFLPLIAGGLLLRFRDVVIVSIILVLTLSLGAYSQSQLTEAQVTIPADNVTILFMILLSIVLLINAFFRAFGGNAQKIVADYVQIATHYQKLSLMMQDRGNVDEYKVYSDVINMIRSDLGFVFAQVYLADEDGKLSRRVRAGRADNQEITVQVTVPETSTLNETVQSREAVNVTTEDAAPRRGHLLPSVRRGISLPIISNTLIIGVLDVQTGEEIFTQDDQQLLQTIAGYLGTRIGNIRHIVSLQDVLDRQETMMDHLRNQVDTPNTRANVGDNLAWNNYLQRTDTGFGFDIDGKPGVVTAAADLSPELRKSLKSGQIDTDVIDDQTTIVIPILLRGEVLGAMQFHTARLTTRQIEIAQKISDRLAQALENRRLFEQSQAQASRERKATEVANQLISATEVNAVLDLAATTFNEALGAVQTRIQIKPSLVRDNDAVTTQTYPQVTAAEGATSTEIIEKEGTINE